jgi:hypothetical protein
VVPLEQQYNPTHRKEDFRIRLKISCAVMNKKNLVHMLFAVKISASSVIFAVDIMQWSFLEFISAGKNFLPTVYSRS